MWSHLQLCNYNLFPQFHHEITGWKCSPICQILYTIKTVKDLVPVFFFWSHFTFLIDFFYEQLMEFTISLSYIFSSHLHSLTMMWEIPHGGEKPHLSAPLFYLAIHNHMNSNFTRRPYSRSDESETTCQEVFLHIVGKKKRMDQMFCFWFLNEDTLNHTSSGFVSKFQMYSVITKIQFGHLEFINFQKVWSS